MIALAFPIALAFAIAVTLTPLLAAAARRFGLFLDVPNRRSSHVIPTPRSGGIAIVVALMAATVFTQPFSRSGLLTLAAAAAVALVSLIDDVRGVHQIVRFLIQSGAAAIAIAGLGVPDTVTLLPGVAITGLPGAALSLFWIVGLTNAFNFMDGINGIAGLQAVLAGVVFGCMLWFAHDAMFATVGLAMAGAALGFLPWNFPRAYTFMGDTSSATLGFLCGVLSLRAGRESVPLAISALPLLPFLLDTTVTLIRRIVRGEPFLSAHRTHYYQRLASLGWTHVQVSALWVSASFAGGVVFITWSGWDGASRWLAAFVLLAGQVAIGLAIENQSRSDDA